MSDQLVGYRYLFGIHMGVSRGPVDELVEIKVGDKAAWRGSVTANGEVAIDAYNLFGGEDGEGGVQGALTVMMGGPTQTAPSALATVLKTPMPGFRRMFTVFFDGIVTMMSPYPKPWKFRVRRAKSGWEGSPWYPEKAVISLVRPLSAGETEGSSETKNLTGSETVTGTRSTISDPFVATISPPGPITSIIDIQYLYYYVVGDNDYYQTISLTTDQYTLVGNTLTVDFDIPGPPVIPLTQVFTVNYNYNLTTVDPLGGLGTGIIQAMNPAHIIYECYTNHEWGRGLDATSLDDVAFRAAADKLFEERFGLCIAWKRKDSIQSFIQSILDHIGGVVYTDRTTAKLKLKLIRNDYIPELLPLYDIENGLTEINDAPIGASGPLITEVRVEYRDPVTNDDRVVRASNIALLQAANGVTNSLSRSYKGLPTQELAGRVAKRDLKTSGPGVRKYNITLDRRGSKIVPGGVIRVQDLSRGITDRVLRVGAVDYGSPQDGKIKVVAMQDVFGLPSTGYASMSPPQWTPPVTRPCVGENVIFELPYRSIYRALNTADFNVVPSSAAFLGVLVEEGSPMNLSYDIAVRPGLPSGEDNAPDDSYLCAIQTVDADEYYSYVVLLSLLEGANNSTTMLEEISNTNLQVLGDAKLTTADPAFGGSSLTLDGLPTSGPNGDHVRHNIGTSFNIHSTPFTIDLWIYPLDVGLANQGLISNDTSSGGITYNIYCLLISTGRIAVTGRGGLSMATANNIVPANAWSHIAITGDGAGNHSIKVNGIQRATGLSTSYTTNVAPSWAIGAHNPAVSSFERYFKGKIKNPRITVGVNRYPGNVDFVPPSSLLRYAPV